MHSFNVALNFENDQIAQLNSIPKLYQWHVKLTKSKDLCKMSSTTNKSFISGGAIVVLKELYISVRLCYFVVKLGKSRASVNNYLLNYSLFQLKSFSFRLQKLHLYFIHNRLIIHWSYKFWQLNIACIVGFCDSNSELFQLSFCLWNTVIFRLNENDSSLPCF